MPEIDYGGYSLYYFEHQTPDSPIPPLLMIHGAGGQCFFWPSQLRRLEGVTIYTPDLPGRVKSTAPGRQTVAEYATDMLALLDALNVQQAILVGHSMGGAIAQQLALDAPERVAGLVLVSTGARLRVTPQILDNVLTNFDNVVEIVIKFAYGPTASDDLKQIGKRELREIKPEVVLGDYLACNSFDVMSRLGEVTMPALVICGSVDQMTPAKYSQYLADHLPDAELHVVENAGHMLPIEFADRMAELVGSWLKERWNT